ncbi:uncharacterized protein [Linepithema humile]|uniref:uncharacterized protein n=1 Tax=Linepithema humile TaxID=83485 RepID=UPI00351F3B67
MADLRRLKQNKATIKGQMTRINNTIKEDTSASEVRVKSKKIESLWHLAQMEAQANNQAEAQAAMAAEQAKHQNMRGDQQGQNDRRLDVRLPTLKLPKFNGNYNEWFLFKDAFQSIIHDSTSLTAIQKFQYLRSLLTGEVASCRRISNDCSELRECMGYIERPATMKKLIVYVRTHLKALQTLELPVDRWDELLIYWLKNKMDFNTQRNWEKESNKERERRPTLEEFLTFLRWIVGGKLIDARSEPPNNFCGLITNAALQAQLERFWNQEETREKRCLTKEEAECERQFIETVERDNTGRFIVALPKKPEVELGESKELVRFSCTGAALGLL